MSLVLLNLFEQKGPSTFDKASRLHEEPSNVRTSPIVVVGSQNTANDEDSKNFHARTSFGHQNIRRYPERVSSPVNSHLETQSSGTLPRTILNDFRLALQHLLNSFGSFVRESDPFFNCSEYRGRI